ncbi:hypothetical protein [Demequina sediminicola]|uniref:hypothetical protein n=1 Tax=Demequina sediminicola TaxID=1095026 RepID=UPI00078418AF|nr:hypothetical protein [Demequina sediminicola]
MASPYTWVPLTSGENPVPGNPVTIENGAAHCSTLAVAIENASGSLKDIETLDVHQPDAVSALREREEEVRGHLNDVQSRYASAGTALDTYAESLAVAGGQSTAGLSSMVAETTSTGFDFPAWITGQSEMRAAPERLALR